MSRDFELDSSQFLSTTSPPITVLPITVACWYKMESAASTEEMGLMQLSEKLQAENFFNLRLDDQVGTGDLQWNVRNEATVSICSSAINWTTGVWQHAAGRSVSSTDHSVFLNGGNEGTSSVDNSPELIDSFAVGVQRLSGSDSDFMDGLIAWPCMWNVALTDAEIASLGAGAHPFMVRPASIISFWPLYGDSSPEIDLVGNTSLTVTGATKGAETFPIYFPGKILQFPSGGSAALTGTAISGGVLESEIVTGGDTIIITLTGDTWVASGATFDAQRQNIIDGLDSAQSEAAGWNVEVRDKEVVGAVVRISDTMVTVTLTAAAAYVITADETITVTVPATALVTSVSAIVATPTFDVTNEVVTAGQLLSIGSNLTGGHNRLHGGMLT